MTNFQPSKVLFFTVRNVNVVWDASEVSSEGETKAFHKASTN